MGKIKMKNRITNEDRRLWVLNDEGLYKWQINSKLSLGRFILQNKYEIDAIIDNISSEKTAALFSLWLNF